MVEPSDALPPSPARLLAPAGVRLRLIAASLAILVSGAALAPTRQDAPPSRVEERANPLIEAQVAANAPPVRPFAGVREVVEGLRAQVVAVLPAPLENRPERRRDLPVPALEGTGGGAGVIVRDGYLLTHAAALDGRLAVQVETAAGTTSDSVVAGYDIDTGLVLLRGASGVGLPALPAALPPAAGDLAVGLGVEAQGPAAQPVFISSVSAERVSVTARHLSPGLPVFTRDGGLIGVMPGGASNVVIRSAAVIDRLLAQAAAGVMPRALGVSVQALGPPLTPMFGDDGVLVSDVVAGGPAATAGLVPGDVLLAVDGVAPTSLDEATSSLAAAAAADAATLRVMRGRRTRDLAVEGAPAYTVAHLAARAGGSLSRGVSAALLPAGVAERAGLAGGARVLAINGQDVDTVPAAERALRRRPTAVLHVVDGTGAYFVAVEAGR